MQDPVLFIFCKGQSQADHMSLPVARWHAAFLREEALEALLRQWRPAAHTSAILKEQNSLTALSAACLQVQASKAPLRQSALQVQNGAT